MHVQARAMARAVDGQLGTLVLSCFVLRAKRDQSSRPHERRMQSFTHENFRDLCLFRRLQINSWPGAMQRRASHVVFQLIVEKMSTLYLWWVQRKQKQVSDGWRMQVRVCHKKECRLQLYLDSFSLFCAELVYIEGMQPSWLHQTKQNRPSSLWFVFSCFCWRVGA